MTDSGITLMSQVPNSPTKTSRDSRWTKAAPQMAMTAASPPRCVPGVAPTLAWAISAEGNSLLEMLPIMKA